MSEEEKEVFDRIKDRTQNGCKCGQCCDERILIKIIERQHKQIIDLHRRKMELMELADKQEDKIKFMEGELEIQKGCSVSRDEIREKIKELEKLYNCNLDTALTSYEMFVFVRSYIDKVKNILNELLEDN